MMEQPGKLSTNENNHPNLFDYSMCNALTRIVRCLFAEKLLDVTRVIISNNHISYPLSDGISKLHFEKTTIYPANTIINRGNIFLESSNGHKVQIQTHEHLIDIILNDLDFRPTMEGINQFNNDVANSIHNDRMARKHRKNWRATIAKKMEKDHERFFTKWVRAHYDIRDGATLLDQWGALEGHPYYPTWKSRPGLNEQDIEDLSAEFGARVTLRIGALRADMTYCEKMPHVKDIHQWLSEVFPDTWPIWCEWLKNEGLEPDMWLPLPLHPWHLKHWIHKHFAKEIKDGILLTDGPMLETAPSMSFRTMLPTSSKLPFIKLPVAIWMTSEMRSLQAKSIHMGPRISSIIDAILKAENGFDGMLDCFREEAAWHFLHPERKNDAEGEFLSVVFRNTSPWQRDSNTLAVTVAALFTELPHRPLPVISEFIELSGQDPSNWFRDYAYIVLKPVLAMYLIYGVALEAHQQNTQILFDEKGIAQAVLIRDFGDGRTWAPALRKQGYELKPYSWPGILSTVFEDDIEPVRTFIVDACFVSHLHELAWFLTDLYRIPDNRMWSILGEELDRVFNELRPRLDEEFWDQERQHFMHHPWFTRSLMRMHLQQYTDYRIQHGLNNPLLA
ncbi:IucA/IucC family protein [Candidatus Arsenophonus triatominarum]|uniref:IucA/IucC family protein n=1 Tax=Candidatus Arsenophonus triatominarum TaxID=57911 RepID=UPI003CCBFF28